MSLIGNETNFFQIYFFDEFTQTCSQRLTAKKLHSYASQKNKNFTLTTQNLSDFFSTAFFYFHTQTRTVGKFNNKIV